MSLSKYERCNTIKADVTFKVAGTATNPSGTKAWISVVKSDGSYLYSSQAASNTGTGTFRYYISTNAGDPLGVYVVLWRGYHNVGGSQGALPIYQRDAFQLVDVEQE